MEYHALETVFDGLSVSLLDENHCCHIYCFTGYSAVINGLTSDTVVIV